MKPYPVLIFNAGSSSIKFAVIDAVNANVFCSGILENLYKKQALLHFTYNGNTASHAIDATELKTCLVEIIALLPESIVIQAIGHRVVHGGCHFQSDAIIDAKTLSLLEETISFAPLHNPANLAVIKMLLKLYPQIKQVAVFDTTFHSAMPEIAYRYAIPKSLYKNDSIRKYGFHGTSHHYIALKTAEILKKSPQQTNVISAHLGNGCSLCAIKNGLSVDTTMGFTPQSGVPMGTRTGDIDPGLLIWLVDQKGYDAQKLHQLLNQSSGLLGLSGLSNDLRVLSQAESSGNEDAKLAIEVFCYQIAKYIAAFWVPLQRVDALVFTGGIGENAANVRAKVIEPLGFLGLTLDSIANQQKQAQVIHQSQSVPILVIPTQEEWMIAKAAKELIEGNSYDE